MTTELVEAPVESRTIENYAANDRIESRNLIQFAIERGVSADQLEKLMELDSRWSALNAEKEYARAMHACQSEMPHVVKDARNDHTRSKFARLETVQKIARPVYSKYGFSLSFTEDKCEIPKHKRTLVEVRHLSGAVHNYYVDLPIDGTGPQGKKSSMNEVQGEISTTSYGQRRLICMVFNVTIADEDDDGQGIQKISGQELEILNDFILSAGADFDLFLQYMEVESLADIPANQFSKALSALQLKRKRAAESAKVAK